MQTAAAVLLATEVWSCYPELLQRADSGVQTVLWEAPGQEVDARLLRSLPVHLFRIHIQVLRYNKKHETGFYSIHTGTLHTGTLALLGLSDQPVRSR